jgi:hypothetical protein
MKKKFIIDLIYWAMIPAICIITLLIAPWTLVTNEKVKRQFKKGIAYELERYRL